MTDPNAPHPNPPEAGQPNQPSAYPPAGQQPPYDGPQAMGPVTTQFARVDPGPSQKFGTLSFILTLIGTVATVVAFTGLDWFNGSKSSTYHQIHNIITIGEANGVGATAIAKVYFSWLGWLLLALTIMMALLAATPTIGGPFRILGVVAAVVSVVLTFVAIKIFKADTLLGLNLSTYSEYLKNARAGFYTAVLGFVLIGIAAAIGPSREQR